VRWLQFGAFSPMMRSHGADAPREIWQFGQKGEKQYDAIEKFIRLRYRLLPYIYSTSWDVTHNRSSMMRALMMDFADDRKVLDINDQYLFGRSLLVAPVTESMYTRENREDYSVTGSRELYLPSGAKWVDFWSGELLNGGQTIRRETPIDIIPLYVKSGSILPIGPELQYAEEKPWDNLEIRVYPGANGSFTLYEDENDNYNYEKGLFSTISFNWDDKRRRLTIGAREGKFPGMLQERTFHITLVSQEKGKGMNLDQKSDRKVVYTGEKITLKL
jgi:alpha-D-xyloside xylohydrolase